MSRVCYPSSRPKTCQAALNRLRGKRIRLLCQDYQDHGMQFVIDVVDIQDFERSYAADVQLACGCIRVHIVAVKEQHWKESQAMSQAAQTLTEEQ